VKKVPAHDDEIDFLFDRIPMKNIDPRVKEIARTFGQRISCAAQMHVGDVQKLHVGKFITFTLPKHGLTVRVNEELKQNLGELCELCVLCVKPYLMTERAVFTQRRKARKGTRKLKITHPTKSPWPYAKLEPNYLTDIA
jgi:hypothetical protein